jgi:regulatory protein
VFYLEWMIVGVITALKQQTKNRNRINVHLDGSYRFALDRALAGDLEVGKEISNDEVEALKSKDAEERLYRRAQRLIDRRPRAEREIKNRFERDKISQDVQEAVIRRLKDRGLIDDHTFVEAWIENRQVFRPRSARALRMELRQKGVSSEIIDQHLADFDDEQAAYAAAIKGARRYRSSDWETFRKRLSAYLIRRGFGYSVISSVVSHVWRETTDREAESEDRK